MGENENVNVEVKDIYTTIRVRRETVERLKLLRKDKNENLASVIERLLEEAKKSEKSEGGVVE